MKSIATIFSIGNVLNIDIEKYIRNIVLYLALKVSSDFGYFLLLPTILISQLIAYPDITNPTLWQFIYIAIIMSLWRTKYETLH